MATNSHQYKKTEQPRTSIHWTQKSRTYGIWNPGPALGTDTAMWQG